MKSSWLSAIVAFGVLVSSTHANAQISAAEQVADAVFEPTAAERVRAFALSDQAIRERNLRSSGLFYNISAELHRDKAFEASGRTDRLVLVTSYRYEGDLTLLTFINLTRGTVMKIESVKNAPTHLSEAEYLIAREKALAHPQVAAKLAEFAGKVTVEAMVSRSPYNKDPLYGHRVVRLLFKVPQGYVVDPIVFVDLTANQVMVDSPSHSHAKRAAGKAAPTHNQHR